MGGLLALLKREPALVWIGLVDGAIQLLIVFNLVPGGFSSEQKGAVDAFLQLVLAVIVRQSVVPKP